MFVYLLAYLLILHMLMTLFSKFLLNILRNVNLVIFTLNILVTFKKNNILYLFRWGYAEYCIPHGIDIKDIDCTGTSNS